ncbi:hypothetical protein MHJ63_09745 [Pseudoglutamicibacter albus]|uniref:hypothetical protein n=1 Tax=Pseudoglutamicibacter albus TaxID=98671 RepID=UPI001EF62226|nr:hypothetical protein [Pseudoglutamicibacter albus]MCG7305543.1 hypothetical protein [Pseudoglutamicibacter albus]
MDSLETNQEEQQFAIVLPREQFLRLLRGEFEGDGPTLYDVADECVLANGEAQAPYAQFWGIYTTRRSFMQVRRLRPDGTENKVYMWTGPRGVIFAVENHTESVVTMSAASLDSRFTLLIDGMVLGRRDFPREYEPGYGVIQQKDILKLLEPDGLPSSELAASTKALADSVAHVQPGMAQDLVDGQYEIISIMGEWESGDRDETASVVYFDTPHGYLLHNTERQMLRKEHHLEPAPGWYILLRAMEVLPPEPVIASWQEEADAHRD